MREGIVIAIDGPTASGKSTAGRCLARKIGAKYLSTGIIYRMVAWEALRRGVDMSDGDAVASLCNRLTCKIRPQDDTFEVVWRGRSIVGELYGNDTSHAASVVSERRTVREAVLNLQRSLGAQGNIVVDGRDVGTVVFPGADVKFFLTASKTERARRRQRELAEAGRGVGLERVRQEICSRDRRDSSRAIAPLRKAEDAVEIDSSQLTVDEVVGLMYATIQRKLGA